MNPHHYIEVPQAPLRLWDIRLAVIVQDVRRQVGCRAKLLLECRKDEFAARAAQDLLEDARSLAHPRKSLSRRNLVFLLDRFLGHQSRPVLGNGQSRFMGVTSMIEVGFTVTILSADMVVSMPLYTATTFIT